MADQSVLVTGGAGFIGRAVAARCLEEKLRVLVFDNLVAGRAENLSEFQGRLQFIHGDILDAAALAAAMKLAAPHTVYHLAAHHYIPFCDAHPQETMRVNVEGTFAVLKAAADAGAAVAVVASSGLLYPGREGLLVEDESTVASDVYGLSKLLCEQVTSHISRTTPMRCRVGRLFNTFGPFETNRHLIPHIIQSLHQGPRVRLGNVHTKRDYIYVADVAEALVRLSHVPESRYEVCNVGTGQEYSAADIIEELKRLTRRDIEVQVDASRIRAGDKAHQRADTRRLAALTGGLPKHSLSEGLAKLLAHEGLV